MQWSQFRVALHSWILAKFRIDSWQLDQPLVKPTVIGFGTDPVVNYTLPPNRAIRHPLTDFSFSYSSLGDRLNAGILYDIQYRFPKSLQYHQLPIVELEVLLLNRVWELSRDAGCVIDGARVTVTDYDQPIIVEPTAANTDWLVTIKIYLKIDLPFEPESISTLLHAPKLADLPRDPITQIDYTANSLDEVEYFNGSVDVSPSVI